MQDFPRRQPGPSKQLVPEVRRPFEIRLSATVLALVGLLIAVTVGWSFVMGFIVGRGDDPGERLARFDPFLKTADENVVASPSQALVEKTPEKTDSQDGEKSAEPQTKQPAPEAPHPFARPRENAEKAWDALDVRVVPKNDKAESASSDRTEYFYQVASYKTRKEAEALSKQLAGQRSRSYVQQNGSLYSVYLSIKANEKEFSDLQSLFVKLRIKGPRLMARKGDSKGTPREPEKKARPVKQEPAPGKTQAKAPDNAKQSGKEAKQDAKKAAQKPAKASDDSRKTKTQAAKSSDSSRTKEGEKTKNQR
ncbi:MAG: SPOR domain-containing protein [Desulfovibrionaceae bacterium]|nr:SPOR domain-containing protein [Desulfovibrionaceae bacterium]